MGYLLETAQLMSESQTLAVALLYVIQDTQCRHFLFLGSQRSSFSREAEKNNFILSQTRDIHIPHDIELFPHVLLAKTLNPSILFQSMFWKCW